VNFIPSGNCFIKKDRFLEAGGFNKELKVSEDTDLGYKIRRKGYRIVNAHSVRAVHLGEPESLKEFFLKELWHGKDVFGIFLRSESKTQNRKVVAFALFYVLVFILGAAFALFSLNGWFFMLLSMALLLPLAISVKTCVSKNSLKYTFQLSLLYLMYGIARAVCILDIRNWING
jgi:GT2 family glycosyltransferase